MIQCILTLLISLTSYQFILSQNTTEYKLKLDVGLAILPTENMGGLLLGFTIENPIKKIAFHFRNDIILEIRKTPLLNSSGVQYPSYQLYLVSLNMLNYLDISYRLTGFEKKDIRASLGAGWIYSGNGYGAFDRFDSTNGYPVITASVFFQPSWYFLELRGNLMLDSFGDYYPVTLSFGCRFPSAKTRN